MKRPWESAQNFSSCAEFCSRTFRFFSLKDFALGSVCPPFKCCLILNMCEPEKEFLIFSNWTLILGSVPCFSVNFKFEFGAPLQFFLSILFFLVRKRLKHLLCFFGNLAKLKSVSSQNLVLLKLNVSGLQHLPHFEPVALSSFSSNEGVFSEPCSLFSSCVFVNLSSALSCFRT